MADGTKYGTRFRSEQVDPFRFAGSVPPHMGLDTPVFDRALLAEIRSEPPRPVSFQRPDPPRPEASVTARLLGDPAPDRLEQAEKLRLAILRKDTRFRLEDAPLAAHTHNDRRGWRASTPDIETPKGNYYPVDVASAKFEARRGDQVLRFPTASEAARCLTGETSPKWAKAVQNAAGGVTKSAFGWTWYRIGERSRRAPTRKRVV